MRNDELADDDLSEFYCIANPPCLKNTFNLFASTNFFKDLYADVLLRDKQETFYLDCHFHDFL